MRSGSFVFTSESVRDGHPDKVCDAISDSLLDACIEANPASRVACETLCKGDLVLVAGEFDLPERIDLDTVVRQAIREIGYTEGPFAADSVRIQAAVTPQDKEIRVAVGAPSLDQGAGDQGMMFGYATDETDALMPLPIHLAHQLSRQISSDRRSGEAPWLRPDGKTQVSVRYEGGEPREVTCVVVSVQHAPDAAQDLIKEYARHSLLPRVLGDWLTPATTIHVNPSGSFVEGGPAVDCGLTGRKIIADTYGGMARHGGGAFSGKDPSKVDRSGAYFCRWVARQLVEIGIAKRVEVQVAYAIGKVEPVSLMVDTFGTGDDAEALAFIGNYDFRPGAIIERLRLLRPIYRSTTNFGHFGRAGLPWEES